MLQTNSEVLKMRNYIKNKMKDRLTYCHEWKNSVDIYLAGKEVTKKANEEYYKSKPLLKLILDVYFIPYNMLRFFRYLRMALPALTSSSPITKAHFAPLRLALLNCLPKAPLE